jgi:hypothetical protein
MPQLLISHYFYKINHSSHYGHTKVLILFSIFFLCSIFAQAQKFELFEIKNGELVWQHTYDYPGPQDSLRREVVSMLKSKIFTQHVVRNEMGYNGELRHYHVDCRRYGRKYNNTPLIYWSGEWSGKFVIEVADNGYRVTIYGLYFENKPQQISRHQTNNPRKGYYVNEIWKKGDHPHFIKSKLDDIKLMSISLRDDFDITKYVSPLAD